MEDMGLSDKDKQMMQTDGKKDFVVAPETQKKLDLEYRHITDAIAEQLQLPRVEPLNRLQKLSGAIMDVAIKKNLLGINNIREFIRNISKIPAWDTLPKHNEKTSREPEGRDGNSTWGEYAKFVLNGNKDLYRMSPKEFETHQLKTRFSFLVPVLKAPDDSVDMKEIVYKVLRNKDEFGQENPTAFIWDQGNKNKERSFKLGINNKEDIAELDLQSTGWEGLRVLDTVKITNKVVYIRNDSGISPSHEQELRLKMLLDENKMVIREIHDPKHGVMLEAIVNHNWTDLEQTKQALCQIAEQAHGGFRKVEDDKELQEILDLSSNRYNFGKPDTDGAIRNIVLSKELVKQIDDLWQRYYDAFPGYLDKVKDLYPLERNRDSDHATFIGGHLKEKLSKARFVQLLVQKAAGVEKGKVGGGTLLFKSNTNEELDHFETDGDIEEIRQCLEVANNGTKDKARESLERLYSMLVQFYDKKRSNVSQKIGTALQLLPTTAVRLDMAEASMKSGAAVAISKQIMTSYSGLDGLYSTQYAQLSTYNESGLVNWSTSPAQASKIYGFGSSAHPDFMDSSFAITAEQEGLSRKGKFKRIIISAKANWETGKKGR
jgi:hypothetical protein